MDTLLPEINFLNFIKLMNIFGSRIGGVMVSIFVIFGIGGVILSFLNMVGGSEFDFQKWWGGVTLLKVTTPIIQPTPHLLNNDWPLRCMTLARLI